MTKETVALDPQLERLVAEFDRIKGVSAQIFDMLDDKEINWRPGPGRWSVAECFEHLSITAEMLLNPLRTAIDDARRKGELKPGPYRHGLIGRFFIRSLEPGGRKVQVPAVYAPTTGPELDAQVLRHRFLSLQDEVKDIIHCANGVDLARVKVSSPALTMLRLNAAEWFAATIAHENRHIEQARRVMLEPSFPRQAVS